MGYISNGFHLTFRGAGLLKVGGGFYLILPGRMRYSSCSSSVDILCSCYARLFLIFGTLASTPLSCILFFTLISKRDLWLLHVERERPNLFHNTRSIEGNVIIHSLCGDAKVAQGEGLAIGGRSEEGVALAETSMEMVDDEPLISQTSCRNGGEKRRLRALRRTSILRVDVYHLHLGRMPRKTMRFTSIS